MKLLKDFINFIKGTPPPLEGEEDPEMEAKKKYELLIQKQKEGHNHDIAPIGAIFTSSLLENFNICMIRSEND